jgi:hypothetical protein
LGNAAHEYCLQRHSSSVVFSQIEELLLDEAAKGKQA